MSLSPKTRRNLLRTLPYGLIWLVTGTSFLLVEQAVTNNQNLNPETAVAVTLPVFIFASIASFFVGLLVGAMEVIVLRNLFRRQRFLLKVFYKFGLYSVVLVGIIVMMFPLATMIELQTGPKDPRVLEKLSNFLTSITFVSTMFQLSFQMMLSVLYSAISEHLGYRMFVNMVTGRYHKPQQENRIFLFLDMKSSTPIAEELGNERYFKLLRDYYSDLSDAIVNHYGEVYQYIGDEIIVTWKPGRGLRDNNCVRCFFAMKEALENRSKHYWAKYGLVPTFKAGLHGGNVTTGEIGALKKEVFFTGDVLNTTARIQGLCNDYGVDLLLSERLTNRLHLDGEFQVKHLGPVELKGKAEPMGVVSVVEKGN